MPEPLDFFDKELKGSRFRKPITFTIAFLTLTATVLPIVTFFRSEENSEQKLTPSTHASPFSNPSAPIPQTTTNNQYNAGRDQIIGNNNSITINEIKETKSTFQHQQKLIDTEQSPRTQETNISQQTTDPPSGQLTKQTLFRWHFVDRNNNPVVGAQIDIPEYGVSAITDANGLASLNFTPDQMVANEKFHITIKKVNQTPVESYVENEFSQKIKLP